MGIGRYHRWVCYYTSVYLNLWGAKIQQKRRREEIMTHRTTDVVENVLSKFQELMPENQQRQIQSREKSRSVEIEQSPLQQRVFGLHQGMGWMSDDFNDPLTDEFWLGET